jgi:hypothetical protein
VTAPDLLRPARVRREHQQHAPFGRDQASRTPRNGSSASPHADDRACVARRSSELVTSPGVFWLDAVARAMRRIGRVLKGLQPVTGEPELPAALVN